MDSPLLGFRAESGVLQHLEKHLLRSFVVLVGQHIDQRLFRRQASGGFECVDYERGGGVVPFHQQLDRFLTNGLIFCLHDGGNQRFDRLRVFLLVCSGQTNSDHQDAKHGDDRCTRLHNPSRVQCG